MRYTTAMGDAYKSYMAFHIHPWYLFMSPWTERKKNIYKACSNERNVEKKIYNRSELWVGLWVHERRAHTPHTIARTHLWRGKRATNDKYVENKNKKQLTHMLCCLCTTYKWNEWMKAIPICLCLCVLCVCVFVYQAHYYIIAWHVQPCPFWILNKAQECQCGIGSKTCFIFQWLYFYFSVIIICYYTTHTNIILPCLCSEHIIYFDFVASYSMYIYVIRQHRRPPTTRLHLFDTVLFFYCHCFLSHLFFDISDENEI